MSRIQSRKSTIEAWLADCSIPEHRSHMSVTTRIRLVGAIASSLAVAVGVFVLFGVWASVSALPGILALGAAGALMGMLTTMICVALTLAVPASDRRLTLSPETTQPLQPQTSYRFPPA
jgi:hypothetical protein